MGMACDQDGNLGPERVGSSSAASAQAALDDRVLDPRGLPPQLPLHVRIHGAIVLLMVAHELAHAEADVATGRPRLHVVIPTPPALEVLLRWQNKQGRDTGRNSLQACACAMRQGNCIGHKATALGIGWMQQ